MNLLIVNWSICYFRLTLLKVSDFEQGHLADMRLGLGLRRSLICFAPLAFVSQRQDP